MVIKSRNISAMRLLTSLQFLQTLTEFLSCTEMRAFWVGWRDGQIRVGKGYRYGREQLIAMAIPRSIHFNAISLSNENVSGQWQFDSDQGTLKTRSRVRAFKPHDTTFIEMCNCVESLICDTGTLNVLVL